MRHKAEAPKLTHQRREKKKLKKTLVKFPVHRGKLSKRRRCNHWSTEHFPFSPMSPSQYKIPIYNIPFILYIMPSYQDKLQCIPKVKKHI